jgi:hypothetical protein
MRKTLLALGYALALLQAGSAAGQEFNEFDPETAEEQVADLPPTTSNRTKLFKCKNGETTVFSDKPCQADLQKQEIVTVIQNDPIDNSDLREKMSLESQANVAAYDAGSDAGQSSGNTVRLGDTATEERNARLNRERDKRPATGRHEQRQDPPISRPVNSDVPVQLVNCSPAGCDGTNGVRYVDVGGGNYLNTQTGQIQRPAN